MSASDTPSLIERLLKRAEIRRSIPRGEPDRISDILEESADALTAANAKLAEYESVEVPEEPVTQAWIIVQEMDFVEIVGGADDDNEVYFGDDYQQIPLVERKCYEALLCAYRAQAVRLRKAERDAAALWKLLDDIDTASDRYKSNYKELAEYVYKMQRKRFEIMTGEQFDAAREA